MVRELTTKRFLRGCLAMAEVCCCSVALRGRTLQRSGLKALR
jgi:hypothetical protein